VQIVFGFRAIPGILEAQAKEGTRIGAVQEFLCLAISLFTGCYERIQIQIVG
jgi:hypothetical protein